MTMWWLFYFLLHDGAQWRINQKQWVWLRHYGTMKIVNFTHAQTAETRCFFLHLWMPGTKLSQTVHIQQPCLTIHEVSPQNVFASITVFAAVSALFRITHFCFYESHSLAEISSLSLSSSSPSSLSPHAQTHPRNLSTIGTSSSSLNPFIINDSSIWLSRNCGKGRKSRKRWNNATSSRWTLTDSH